MPLIMAAIIGGCLSFVCAMKGGFIMALCAASAGGSIFASLAAARIYRRRQAFMGSRRIGALKTTHRASLRIAVRPKRMVPPL
jgi:hypothetical protein